MTGSNRGSLLNRCNRVLRRFNFQSAPLGACPRRSELLPEPLSSEKSFVFLQEYGFISMTEDIIAAFQTPLEPQCLLLSTSAKHFKKDKKFRNVVKI